MNSTGNYEKLQDGAQLLSLYFQLPVLIDPRADFPLGPFCSRAVLLKDYQSLYSEDRLTSLLESSPDQRILLLEDPLGTVSVLVLASSSALLFGPFVPEPFQEKKGQRLLSRALSYSESMFLQFKLYWCDLSVCDPESFLRAVYCMLENAGFPSGSFALEKVTAAAPQAAPRTGIQLSEQQKWQADSFEKIACRYEMEEKFMAQIAAGNKDAAISELRQILRQSRPQHGMAVDLWSMDSAMAIMRTLIRVAARQSGLPAVIVDTISLEFGQKMRLTGGDHHKTVLLYEQMVEEYCMEINRMKDSGCSPMIQKTLHLIRTGYAEPLSIGFAAEVLDVSESTLSRRLKAETGATFTALLTKERIRQAALLLSASDSPIQEVCSAVGFPDQNYFVKVFRKQYGMTPTDYRKSFQAKIAND